MVKVRIRASRMVLIVIRAVLPSRLVINTE